MAAIRIVDHDSLPWTRPVSGQSGGSEEVADPNERGGSRRPHLGENGELYLHESKTPPNHEVAAHVHKVDEIIYVIEGELHLGARVLGPGSSVYIPADTLYGFKAGPNGLRFLNFRGSGNRAHVLKEDFLAERERAKAGA